MKFIYPLLILLFGMLSSCSSALYVLVPEGEVPSKKISKIATQNEVLRWWERGTANEGPSNYDISQVRRLDYNHQFRVLHNDRFINLSLEEPYFNRVHLLDRISGGVFEFKTFDKRIELSAPSVSPNGQLIAVVASPLVGGGISEIWVFDFQGNLKHQIYQDYRKYSSPQFSSDGKSIIYGRTVGQIRDGAKRNPEMLLGQPFDATSVFEYNLSTKRETQIIPIKRSGGSLSVELGTDDRTIFVRGGAVSVDSSGTRTPRELSNYMPCYPNCRFSEEMHWGGYYTISRHIDGATAKPMIFPSQLSGAVKIRQANGNYAIVRRVDRDKRMPIGKNDEINSYTFHYQMDLLSGNLLEKHKIKVGGILPERAIYHSSSSDGCIWASQVYNRNSATLEPIADDQGGYWSVEIKDSCSNNTFVKSLEENVKFNEILLNWKFQNGSRIR